MTVIGLLLIGVAVVADLSPIVTLTGMLLFVAGIVKIAMIAIWKSFFSIPVDAPPNPMDRLRPAARNKEEV
jgi:hypothetical protein